MAQSVRQPTGRGTSHWQAAHRHLTGVLREVDRHQAIEGRQAASAGGKQACQLIRQGGAAAAAAGALVASWRRLALLVVLACGGTCACLALRLACAKTRAANVGRGDWRERAGTAGQWAVHLRSVMPASALQAQPAPPPPTRTRHLPFALLACGCGDDLDVLVLHHWPQPLHLAAPREPGEQRRDAALQAALPACAGGGGGQSQLRSC